MSEEQFSTSTRTSRIVQARPEHVYVACMDPAALVAWLPPDPRRASRHLWVGKAGGHRMSLPTPPGEGSFEGKTSPRGWMSSMGGSSELVPPRRIVEAVTFDTADPAFRGEMTIVVTLEGSSSGTEVTFLCMNPRVYGQRTTKPARACHWSRRRAALRDQQPGMGSAPDVLAVLRVCKSLRFSALLSRLSIN